MTHEILNFKSENEDIPFYRLSFFILYHYYITILAGMQMSMMNIFFADFPNILLETNRFCHLDWLNIRDAPNNDPKWVKNTITFVKFGRFWVIWRDLEKIGFQFG